MSTSVGQISKSLREYQTMISQSQSSMDDLSAMLTNVQSNLDNILNGLPSPQRVLSGCWAAQVVIFSQGWELFQGTADRMENAQPSAGSRTGNRGLRRIFRRGVPRDRIRLSTQKFQYHTTHTNRRHSMAFTLDTTLGTLLDNPQAKAVMEQYLPGISTIDGGHGEGQ